MKVTGELTMSFPAGIIRVFSGTLAPPVLSFRLLNAAAIEQFLPNTDLLYRCGHLVAPWHPAAGWGQPGQDGGSGREVVSGYGLCPGGQWMDLEGWWVAVVGTGVGVQEMPGGHSHPWRWWMPG